MLSHINEDNQPKMVDVGSKTPTQRSARARAVVRLTPSLAALLNNGEIHGPKGPVFQTAIIAGIQAVKRTPDLIPMCHSLAIEGVDISIEADQHEARILCTVRCTGKTGVEMEALTGASIAALTVIDMGKALGPGLSIDEVVLLEKTGGKHGTYQLQ